MDFDAFSARDIFLAEQADIHGRSLSFAIAGALGIPIRSYKKLTNKKWRSAKLILTYAKYDNERPDTILPLNEVKRYLPPPYGTGILWSR